MKKTQEIIGLPIISIYDGIEVGRVKNIIINASKRAIEYLIIDSGIEFISAKVVPTVSVLGIGEYAVTIENESVISYLSEIPAAIELLQKNIPITGTKLLTKKGRLIGEVGDIYVDENENCNIIGLEYLHDNKIKIIPRTSIISISKDFVVVIEEVENSLVDKPEDIVTMACAQKDEKDMFDYDVDHNSDSIENVDIEQKELITEEVNSLLKEIEKYYPDLQLEPEVSKQGGLDFSLSEKDETNYEEFFTNEDDYFTKDFNNIELDEIYFGNLEDGYLSEEAEKDVQPLDVQPLIEDTEKDLEDKKSIQQPSFFDASKLKTSGGILGQSSAAHLFEQRQKEYLNGKRVTKTIVSDSGTVIIRQGETITDEVIEVSKQNGKLIELIMNNEV